MFLSSVLADAGEYSLAVVCECWTLPWPVLFFTCRSQVSKKIQSIAPHIHHLNIGVLGFFPPQTNMLLFATNQTNLKQKQTVFIQALEVLKLRAEMLWDIFMHFSSTHIERSIFSSHCFMLVPLIKVLSCWKRTKLVPLCF